MHLFFIRFREAQIRRGVSWNCVLHYLIGKKPCVQQKPIARHKRFKMAAVSRTSLAFSICLLLAGLPSECESGNFFEDLGTFLGQTLIEKPVREVARAIGLRTSSERQTHQVMDLIQAVARQVVVRDKYTVANVKPCPDGRHDIVRTNEPVTIHSEGGKVIVQDRFCRKCGMHFYGEP